RAAVKRLERRCEPDAHRPAPRAGRGLNECHVDAVDVRPLLAIDLDRDEMPVEDPGQLAALEALMLHDVAPVTRRIADREKDGLVFAAGARKCLVAPRIPVNG